MIIKLLITSVVLLVFFLFLCRPKQNKVTLRYSERFAKRLSNGVQNLARPEKVCSAKQVSRKALGQSIIAVPSKLLSLQLRSAPLDAQEKADLIKITQSFCKPHPLLIPLLRTSFDTHELYDLVKSDLELSAKILKRVNSPFFYLRNEITNINHAIVFLGAVQVKSIAVQLAIKSEMTFSDKVQNEAYNNLWSASYMASNFCFLFAKHLGKENSTELSTLCLLSYLGDQALLSYQPSLANNYLAKTCLLQRVNNTQSELSTNSAVVGQILAEQWELPQVVIDAIGRSLLPLTDLNQVQGINNEELKDTLLCYIACRLSDLVVFHGVRDIAKLDILDGGLGIEFQYVSRNLQQLGFGQVNDIFSNSEFTLKANKQIAQLFGPQ